MKNKKAIHLISLIMILSACSAFAIKANKVEIGLDSLYDNKVSIYRSDEGNMMFQDDSIATPVALISMVERGVSAHSELTGLALDDHHQYLTTARHTSAHNAAFNDSLAISPDINGNDTLSEHLSDPDIHPDRHEPQTMFAPWTFSDNVYFEGAIYGDGSTLNNIEKRKRGIISVAKSGGDYSAIQSAIDSIQNPSAANQYVIIVYPGDYEERVLLNKDYVSLIGVSREKCRIKSNPSGTTPTDASVYVTGAHASIQNLAIENTYSGGLNAESALTLGAADIHIKNCDVISQGRDTVWGLSSCAETVLENCRITGQYDIISTYGSLTLRDNIIERLSNTSSNSFVWAMTSGAALEFNSYCNTYLTDYPSGFATLDNSGGGSLVFTSLLDSFNYDVSQFYKTGSPEVRFAYSLMSKVNTSLDVNGNLQADNLYARNIWSRDSEGAGRLKINEASLIFYNELGSDGDTNLYRSDIEELSTDGKFICGSLNSNGDIEGNVARWKDYAAVALGGMNVSGYQTIDNNSSLYSYAGWMAEGALSPQYIYTYTDDVSVFFPVTYEAGTVISRLRVKWQAEGQGDGVKIRLVKRDESGSAGAWTIVSASDSYTDNVPDLDVKVSVFDLPDAALSVNYSYSIEVISDVASYAVRLYSVGIETSKRIY